MAARRAVLTAGLAAGALGVAGPASAAVPTPVRVLCVGDSITNGTNSSDGLGYRSFLAERLADLGYAATLVPACGGGLMVDTVRPFVDQALASGPPPDLALFYLGTNDIVSIPMTGWPERYRDLVGYVLGHNPAMRALVAKMTLRIGMEQFCRNVNVWIANNTVAPHGSRAKTVALDSLPNSHHTDGVHPGDAGYSLVADLWLHAMRPWLPA